MSAGEEAFQEKLGVRVSRLLLFCGVASATVSGVDGGKKQPEKIIAINEITAIMPVSLFI
jgi:hypothetical protein